MSGQGLVDDNCEWRALPVGVRESPALEQGYAEGAEIVSTDEEEISKRIRFVQWSRPPFDGEGILDLHEVGRQAGRHSRGPHSGQSLDPLEKLMVKAGDMLGIGIAEVRHRDLRR